MAAAGLAAIRSWSALAAAEAGAKAGAWAAFAAPLLARCVASLARPAGAEDSRLRQSVDAAVAEPILHALAQGSLAAFARVGRAGGG